MVLVDINVVPPTFNLTHSLVLPGTEFVDVGEVFFLFWGPLSAIVCLKIITLTTV